MRFTSLPLKAKLVIALTGPLIALGALGIIQVRSLQSEQQLADEQLRQVTDNLAIIEVLDAVQAERDSQLTVLDNFQILSSSGMGADSDGLFDRTRENTDGAIATTLATPDLSDAAVAAIATLQSSLDAARTDLDNELEAVDPNASASITSSLTTLGAFDSIVSDAIRAIEVDPDRLLEPKTAVDLESLIIALEFDELVRLEALSYLQLALLPLDEQPDALVREAQLRSGQVQAYESTVSRLSSESYRESFQALLLSPEYDDIRDLRSTVLSSNAGEIFIAQNRVLVFLSDMTGQLEIANGDIIASAQADAVGARDAAQRALTIGALLTLSLIAAMAFVSYSSYRSIRRPLVELTDRSRTIADEELPAVVSLLREHGLDADVPEIVPIEAQTNDEIGGLVHAFNDMHRTAVELASEQAASRSVVADMFVNLGRRNQKLLSRILAYLDSLEQDQRDPETLEQLFKIDHLATRMRRNAESLLVLAGAKASRVFASPVPIGDVARSALAEVEGYERVDLDIRSDMAISGTVVVDLGHLLAELLENALTFSPPDSRVVLVAAETRSGFSLAVVDQGIGMSESQLTEMNERITAAATLEETPSKYLGLHVVGRLASRHGIRVDVSSGVVQGVAARILLPTGLYSSIDGSASEEGPGPVNPKKEALADKLADSAAADLTQTVAASLDNASGNATELNTASIIGDVGPDVAPVIDPIEASTPSTTPGPKDRRRSPEPAPAPAPETAAPATPAAAAPTPAAPATPPADRPVLDVGNLPRRSRGADEPAAAPTPVPASAEAAPAPTDRRKSDNADTDGPTPVAFARRTPGATRTPAPAPQSDAGQPSPEPVRRDGKAFASSLAGFQKAVKRADDEKSNAKNEEQA